MSDSYYAKVVDSVQISKAEYEQMLKDVRFLCCLEAAGVDNWEGYDFAREEYQERWGDED